MYRTKTTFVIGAGASHEYGFPVGSVLMEQVERALAFSEDDYGRGRGGDEVLRDVVLRHCGGTWERFKPYYRASALIREGMRIWPSIDNCLHMLREAGQTDAVELGKLAIAHCILAAERGSKLCPRRNQALELAEPTLRSAYLRALASQFVGGFPRLTDEIFENVAFVIFNYDRVVEHFLFRALQSAYPTETEGSIAEVLNNITFVHPYGSLGRLPWQTGASQVLPFGEDVKDQRLVNIAQNIRTFTERDHESEHLANIQDVYSRAEQVVFLGFGFFQENLDLLAGKAITPKAGRIRRLMATSFGIHEDQYSVLKKNLRRTFHAHGNIVVEEPTMIAIECKEFVSRLSMVLAG